MRGPEAVIELVGEEREDGSLYLSSPDVPLFHIVAPNEERALELALPILKEQLQHKLGGPVELRPARQLKNLKSDVPHEVTIPSHVIAEMLN